MMGWRTDRQLRGSEQPPTLPTLPPLRNSKRNLRLNNVHLRKLQTVAKIAEVPTREGSPPAPSSSEPQRGTGSPGRNDRQPRANSISSGIRIDLPLHRLLVTHDRSGLVAVSAGAACLFR